MAMRYQLSDAQVHAFSKAITVSCAKECFANARIGIYLPIQNEVDLTMLYDTLHASCTFYVPHILNKTKMEFVRYDHNDPMQTNFYGIQEPQTLEPIDPLDLDIIFVPIVAFSSQCDRLGHGSGYYDRYLETTMAKKIGVAYELQRWEGILCFPHDVKLDSVITETQIYQSYDPSLD